MSNVSREIHMRQCYCTVFTTFRCHCHSALRYICHLCSILWNLKAPRQKISPPSFKTAQEIEFPNAMYDLQLQFALRSCPRSVWRMHRQQFFHQPNVVALLRAAAALFAPFRQNVLQLADFQLLEIQLRVVVCLLYRNKQKVLWGVEIANIT